MCPSSVGWAAAVLVAVTVQLGWLLLGGLREHATFPLDDAWIHQVFARSLAAGRGFAYSADMPSAGCSSPLWAVTLAVPAALGVPALVGGTTASLAASLGAILAGAIWASRIHDRLTGQVAPRWFGPVAVVVLSLCPILTWNAGSGMEGPAAAAFGLAGGALRLGGGRQRRLGALCFGFAVGMRLEIVAALPLLLVDGRWTDRRPDSAGALPSAAVDIILALLPASGILSVMHASTGRWLPQTLEAKVGDQLLTRVLMQLPGADGVEEVLQRLAMGVAAVVTVPTYGMPIVGGVLLALGVLVARGDIQGRRALLLPAGWLVLQVLGMELLPQPGGALSHEGRYVVPLVLLGQVVALVGAVVVGRVLGGLHPGADRVTPVLLAGMLLLNAIGGVSTAGRARDNRREIDNLQVDLGRWLGAHAGPGTVIAARDVGAVGYFAPDARIIDLLGLVSPEWLDVGKDSRALQRVIREEAPDYVEVFLGEWPEITAACVEVTRRSELRATVSSRRQMVVYACAWEASRTGED